MRTRAAVLTRLGNNWFLLALVVMVAVGSLAHHALAPLVEIRGLQTLLVFSVMWMMAAAVPFELVTRTLARPGPGLLATAINLGLVPLLALAVSPLLAWDLAGGLIVAATVPSTLASAAVWTRKAGGDDTVAVFVTLLTNLSCVIITPLWLMFLMGVQVQLNPIELTQSLMLIVVLPIALAQVMRWSRAFCELAERSKSSWATLSQVGILIMVLLGSIQMGQRLAAGAGTAASVDAVQIAAVIAAATLVHCAALTVAWFAAGWCGIKRPQQIAVALAGSQKTLMVGLKLAIDCGVSILPMVVFHVSQLLVDTLIVQRWSRRDTPG